MKLVAACSVQKKLEPSQVCIDFGRVIINVFSEEQRAFYGPPNMLTKNSSLPKFKM